ncbi:MAG TPA: AarF/UbiB family protein, partial [Gammaproteobacteria bacterium]|nr:AarF/UbiB family protein [Gammaproteobacteria bacterium]
KDIADELALLQDQVPPFSSAVARKIIKETLGDRAEELLHHFEDTPIGSASIAQVHGTRLENGDEVVVKLLRPDIEKQIKQDIQLLALLARMLTVISPTLKKLNIQNVVNEFKLITAKELDLQAEVANASQLARNMQSLDYVVIPQVYWPYTRKNIAVFERIHAIRIADKERLKNSDIDLTLLAQRTLELFFTAVFEHNFFHADMHPGNIFIEKVDDEIKYILVDFGIMGTLPTQDQRYLAENLGAFFQQDYDRVAQLHIASGWVPANTRHDAFATAIRTVCEPIFARSPHEISFAELFLGLLNTARTFDMEVLPQMILLQKTLMNVEGLARYLDPNIDIWQSAKPILKKWSSKGSQIKRLRHQLRDAPLWIDQVLRLPSLATQALERFNQQLAQKKNKTLYYKSFATGFGCAVLIVTLGLTFFFKVM